VLVDNATVREIEKDGRIAAQTILFELQLLAWMSLGQLSISEDLLSHVNVCLGVIFYQIPR